MYSAGVGMREYEYDIIPEITIRIQHLGKPTETQRDIILTRRRW